MSSKNNYSQSCILSVRQKVTPACRQGRDLSPWINGKSLLVQDSAPRAKTRWVSRSFAWFLMFFCFFVCVPGSLCLADQDDESIQLINTYIQAVNAGDPVGIGSAWIALDQNPQALAYMQVNMPKLAYLYRVRGLYMQLQELQADRPDLFGGEDPSVSIVRSVQTLRSDLAPQALSQVEKFSVSSQDRLRPRTNQDIVLDAQGRPLQDNRKIALSNPNQDRIGNIQYIKNRVDTMFSQKFQEVPGELVPRGNSFPKTRPSADADVRIQGLYSEVVLRKTSAREASFDVLVNGRVVISRLDLRDVDVTINVYFEPGRNTLKLVHANRPPSSAVSLIAVFQQSVAGQQQVVLDFAPGRSQELQIEALP